MQRLWWQSLLNALLPLGDARWQFCSPLSSLLSTIKKTSPNLCDKASSTTIPAAMALVARPTAVNFAKLEKRYGYQEVGSEAPLTTVWTEPASCVSAIPTISAGFCDSQSCSPYPDASIVSILSDAGASVDYPAFTTGQAQTSTDCMPSGYADLKLFYFTGGTQCPLSWSTATVTSDSYSKTIVCCPS